MTTMNLICINPYIFWIYSLLTCIYLYFAIGWIEALLPLIGIFGAYMTSTFYIKVDEKNIIKEKDNSVL